MSAGYPASAACGQCAWCAGGHAPRRRGWELVCPHGFGCCQNCRTCSPSEHMPTAAPRVLAKHQLADILPGGVVCTCGAELAALNPPFDDEMVKGEPLALAVHQLQALRETVRCDV